jgi:NadR type nicotinamide-nucleotide adenylyltransferase
VVIGPESTGKSFLCEQLSAHFNCTWCPEFAREFLLREGNRYDYDDLLEIARGQVQMEDRSIEQSESRHPFLFIDTDMYVMKVWAEFVFGKCHRYILEQAAQRRYDLYLLCNTDLPWVKDELREYPDLETRKILFNIYKDIMVNQDTPWVEIKGLEEERFSIAKDAIQKLS